MASSTCFRSSSMKCTMDLSDINMLSFIVNVNLSAAKDTVEGTTDDVKLISAPPARFCLTGGVQFLRICENSMKIRVLYNTNGGMEAPHPDKEQPCLQKC